MNSLIFIRRAEEIGDFGQPLDSFQCAHSSPSSSCAPAGGTSVLERETEGNLLPPPPAELVALCSVSESGFSAMRWWRKMVVPMRRIWNVVAKSVGIRKTGLLQLRQEVRTCEYQDVQVLWDMLNRNEMELVGSKTKKKQFWSVSDWARRLSRSL